MAWMKWWRSRGDGDETTHQEAFEAKPEVSPVGDVASAWGELRSMLAIRTQPLDASHLDKLGGDFLTLTRDLHSAQRGELSQYVRSWLNQSPHEHSRLLHPKMLGELQQHTSLLEIARAQAYHPRFWANASLINKNHRDIEWLTRHAPLGMEHATETVHLALFETNAAQVDALGFLKSLAPRALHLPRFDPRSPLVFKASALFDTSRLERLLISRIDAPDSDVDPVLRAHLNQRLFALGVRDAYRRRPLFTISHSERLWFEHLDEPSPPPPKPWLGQELFGSRASIRCVHVKRLDIALWSWLASQEWWSKVTHVFAHQVVTCDRVMGKPSLMDLVLDHDWPPGSSLSVHNLDSVIDLLGMALDGILAQSELSILCKAPLSARCIEIASAIDPSLHFEFFPFDRESRWDRY